MTFDKQYVQIWFVYNENHKYYVAVGSDNNLFASDDGWIGNFENCICVLIWNMNETEGSYGVKQRHFNPLLGASGKNVSIPNLDFDRHWVSLEQHHQ